MLKILSGAQTGSDRGALEAALELGLPYGGWVPKGRLAEDGVVPATFTQLQEMQSRDYKRRTWANVRDSQATVIICTQPPSGGSKLTVRYCRELEKPLLILDAAKVVTDPVFTSMHVLTFVRAHGIGILNVAGSRESKCQGLQAAVRRVIKLVLVELNKEPA